ncbi:disease resistance-responsive (dirigent-likeprotein) family protein [Striga asiatica]|uniref:Disease resistance-responsive (Dirigent-likeprotein) family protein n=1 Tax=Striga asiatica TaxID=4170 RepID=A0A5A7RA48_STRAF|nr:disease resistance-responsive (dirigent-likeprotein) family protein [Striga asiatica]
MPNREPHKQPEIHHPQNHQQQSLLSHDPPVTRSTNDTSKLLTKYPMDSVLRKSPVLIDFILSGASLMKNSSCPTYANASPAPTRKNCGTSQNAVILTFPSTKKLLRRRSTRAAAPIPATENASPIPTRWRQVRPWARPVTRRASGTMARSLREVKRRIVEMRKNENEPAGTGNDPSRRSMNVACSIFCRVRKLRGVILVEHRVLGRKNEASPPPRGPDDPPNHGQRASLGLPEPHGHREKRAEADAEVEAVEEVIHGTLLLRVGRVELVRPKSRHVRLYSAAADRDRVEGRVEHCQLAAVGLDAHGSARGVAGGRTHARDCCGQG